MAVSLLNKIRGVMLGDSYDEEDYEDYEDEFEEDEPVLRNIESTRQYSSKRGTSSKVVNLHTNDKMEVVVATPETLEEAGEVCDCLKSKKIIIVNLEKVEHENAQRISDFLCGACYALDGSIQLIADEIFVVAPLNVDVSGQFKEELQANGIKLPYTAMWR